MENKIDEDIGRKREGQEREEKGGEEVREGEREREIQK